MAQKQTPSRAQRRTPRVRCFVSVAAMQQGAHSIAAARPASAPRAALPLRLQMRTPELPEHSLASPLSFPRSLVLRALRNAAAVPGGRPTALWPYHPAPVSYHTCSGTVRCGQSTDHIHRDAAEIIVQMGSQIKVSVWVSKPLSENNIAFK